MRTATSLTAEQFCFTGGCLHQTYHLIRNCAMRRRNSSNIRESRIISYSSNVSPRGK